MKNQIKRKRLFFDIETSPNIGFFWRAGHDLDIPHQDVVVERAVICICYKWEGEKTIHSLRWDSNHNDKKMLQAFVKVMGVSDEIVAHNGDFFDIRWIRTRCAKHGIPLPYDITSLDTCKFAKSKFMFNSNKLDYIGKFFGFGGKMDNGGIELWKNIIFKKDRRAMATMIRYCKRDVQLLEKVFNKLNSYVPAKSHFGTTPSSCPECGSFNSVINKHRITAAGSKKTTLQCKDCGKYHTIATSKFNKDKGV